MQSQKHLFRIPADVTYLNCAYMSPLPVAVEQTGIENIARKSNPWTIAAEDFFKPVTALKKRFARLVNAEDHERIAIIPSVSYGLASVANNLTIGPGQHIVMLKEQFPSNYYTWQRLADETGATLRIVAPPDTSSGRGGKWNERLLESIDEQTAAVALPHVHWADGTLFDLKAIRHRTREVGAMMIIDGTQSVGAMPFDVRELEPDALVCAGYKWLLGPYGIGLAYYGPEMDGGVPIEENWINRLNSDDFQSLVNFQPAYQPMANRYNVGQCSRFTDIPMLTTALDLLLYWGPENIQEYCRQITREGLGQLQELGCWIEEENARGAHLFGVRLPTANANMERLRQAAANVSLYLSFRGNAVRVSPNVYNEKADIDKLLKLFRSCLV